MRPKSLVLLGLALGCGLIASIGISQVLDNSNRPAAVETAPIYVALKNINVGDPLDDKMVSLEEWPKDKVPLGAITKWEEIEDRRPRSNIYQGEPILDNKLLARGQTNDPMQGVPAGMRLKTVAVDAKKSAAGLLSPGDRVDVQIFVKANESQGFPNSFTKIFLQNIRVYAIDQTIDKAVEGDDNRVVAKTVSLIVTPAQASRITLAENLGEISLVPRHPDDDKIVDDSEQDANELFGRSTAGNRQQEQGSKAAGALAGFKSIVADAMAAAAANAANQAATPAAPPKPSFEMTIISPNDVSQVQFDANGDPIDPKSTPAPAAAPTAFVAQPKAATPAPAPADGAATPPGFPIDLRLK